ncbi:MAG: hypothetical protein WCF85_02965 [Rhodospirillaceae bacterium]
MHALLHSGSAFRRSTVPLLVPAMLTALALAGCSGLPGYVKDQADLSCPKVGIVRGANMVTLFGPGPGRKPVDVVGRGLIADYSGNCTYDNSGVTVDVSLALVGERGPATTGGPLPLTYFVAVSAPDGTVVTKQEFSTTIDFTSGGPRAGSREDLSPHIPLPKGQNAGGYQLLVGFQLTPEQLDYNRRSETK